MGRSFRLKSAHISSADPARLQDRLGSDRLALPFLTYLRRELQRLWRLTIMTTKKVLLALAATGLLAFGSAAPGWAEDPPPPDEGTTMDVPADPDGEVQGEGMPDPGVDEGADTGTNDTNDGGGDSGGSEPQGDPQ
jgi:hypothetical protein